MGITLFESVHHKVEGLAVVEKEGAEAFSR